MLVICLGIYSATAAGLEHPPTTIEGDEIAVEVLGHSTSLRRLWFPTETGVKIENKQLALELCRQGRVRYALFASVNWQSTEIQGQLERLLEEK